MYRACLTALLCLWMAAPCLCIEAKLSRAIRLLVTQEYDRATYELKRILKDNPDDFDALYLMLATHQTRILDYESYTIEDVSYFEHADSILGVLSKRLPDLRGADSIRCLFYMGNIHGGKSIMLAKKEKWFAAAGIAFTSVGFLKEVIERDPNYYAAYLGNGVFNYYLSKNLKWVPGFHGKAKKGLTDIRLATKSPFPYNLVAKNSLCWIHIERKEFALADSVAATVIAELPYNTIFLRIRALIAMYTGQWERAERLAERLVDASSRRSPTNWSDMTCGYHILVKALHERKDMDGALAKAEEALGMRVPSKYRRIPYVTQHLKSIEEVAASCKAAPVP